MTRQDAREVARTTERLCKAKPTEPTERDGLIEWRDHVEDALTLHRIAGSLHRYDERACSEDLTCQTCGGDGDGVLERDAGYSGPYVACPDCAGRGRTTGRREAALEAKAQAIASAYGFRAYFQGDCRGCPLYLVPEHYPVSEDASTYSSRGHAVVWLG